MNALATLIEFVEVAALIVLVIYLIRITRDKDDREPRSAIIDKNLAELADFNRILVGSPDLARIWQDGRADRRLNDIDQERFSLLANDYLTLLANQRQRAEAIQDAALIDASTLKLVDTLLLNPGLMPEWEEIADKVASPALRDAVTKAMNPAEIEDDSAPEPEAAGEVEEALTGEEVPVAVLEKAAPASETVADQASAISSESDAPENSDSESPADAATDGQAKEFSSPAPATDPESSSIVKASRPVDSGQPGNDPNSDEEVDALPAKAS